MRARSTKHSKLDVRLPGKGNSNCHDARPVHLIISMIKWFRTSRSPIKKSLSARPGFRVQGFTAEGGELAAERARERERERHAERKSEREREEEIHGEREKKSEKGGFACSIGGRQTPASAGSPG